MERSWLMMKAINCSLIIFLFSSWELPVRLDQSCLPHGLGLSSRFCESMLVHVCACVCSLLFLSLSLTLFNQNFIKSHHRERFDNLEAAHGSTWLLRHPAELRMPVPFHLKLFLEYDCAVFKAKCEENGSSVIFSHTSCLERLWMALSLPSRTKESWSSPRASCGVWSWQFLANKVSESLSGVTGLERMSLLEAWGGALQKALWNKERKGKINWRVFWTPHCLLIPSLTTQSNQWKIRVWSWHFRNPAV